MTRSALSNLGEPANVADVPGDLAQLIAEATAKYRDILDAPPVPDPSELPKHPLLPTIDLSGRDLIPTDEVEAREVQLAGEIEFLRKTLEAQQKTTRDAVNTATELKQKLTETKTQVEKSLKQVHGGQKARIERAEGTVAQLRSQYQIAQRDLEREKRARRTESIAASARTTEMEEALAFAVATEAAHSAGRVQTSHRLRKSLIAAALVIMIGGFGFYQVLHRRQSPTASTRIPLASLTPATSSGQAIRGRVLSKPLSVEAPSTLSQGEKVDLTQSLDRLNRALAAFPGMDPHELLRQVSSSGHSSECSFNWNNGNPSLVFNGGHISISQTLDRCAEAIEKYR
jgi:hypothetical protein